MRTWFVGRGSWLAGRGSWFVGGPPSGRSQNGVSFRGQGPRNLLDSDCGWGGIPTEKQIPHFVRNDMVGTIAQCHSEGLGPRNLLDSTFAMQQQIPRGVYPERSRGARNDKEGAVVGKLQRLVVVLLGALVVSPSMSFGQTAAEAGLRPSAAHTVSDTVTARKRLSDWLLEHAAVPDAYPLGLSWRVPGEVVAQSELKLGLLKSLSGRDRAVKAAPEVLSRLSEWVRTLPVTGRVPVALPDARWLQANQARDPVLQPGESVVLPKRPRTVTVVTARGTRCVVTHRAGAEAMAYVEACEPKSKGVDWFWAGQPDWVWIAQPDGRVQRFGVAAWNREAQDEPAPGAWIWAPPWNAGFPQRLSRQLIEFLATQGPAEAVVRGSLLVARNTSKSVVRGSLLVARNTSKSVVRGSLLVARNSPTNHESRTTTHDPRTTTHEPRPTNHEPRPTNHEPRPTNHEPRPTNHGAGGVSAPWTPAGLPELGGALREPKGQAELDGGMAVLPPPAPSSRSRGPVVTASDWGGVGLLQTPSARMEKAGNLTVNFTRVYPYFNGNVMVQPLDWLEAGFRYTKVSNRLYSSDPNFSGNQAYLDKSFDAKFRLWTESAYVPQVALGFHDIAGTGLFSGEYLVGSKRTGPLDWSLGLGWGYVGGRGDLANPLGHLFSSFNRRKGATSTGNFAFGSYFHGPTALFGGVQYQTPWEPLILKLEYDGNDYQHQPQGNNQRQSSPWNFGAVYRVGRAMDVSLGVERGNTAMLGVTFHTPLEGLSMPKLNDPPRIPVTASRPQRAPDWSRTSRDITAQTDWHVRSIEQHDRELRVTLDDADASYWRERDDRAASVLNRDAPADVDRFALTYREHGVDVAEHVIDRDAWVAQQTQPLPPDAQRAAVIARAPETLPPERPFYQHRLPRFESGLGPSYQQTLGGPDGFLLYQIGAVENAKLRLSDDTWLQGSLQLGLIDNYNKFTNTGSSKMPRVRTYLREYVTTSRLTLPNLQLTHVGRFGKNQYYSLYGGYLESEFAGVGGEWLYRPFASRVAYGVDANYVQQRNFAQNFGFGDAGTQTGYRVATGHGTLYWDTGWNNVLAKVSVGRYLAKDIGATFDVSRVFDNGVRFGAFFTKTNVSSATFGEGSFDKGVYLSVPFDAFLTRSSSSTATAVWKPLTRDGGAMLNRSVELYDLTRARDDRTLRYHAAPPPNDESSPENRRETWTPPPKGPAPYTQVAPRPVAGQWAADAQGYAQRLTEALYRQQFRNIRVSYDASRRLTIALSSDTLHPASRAVGRAARTALHLGPLDMREIRIELARDADPVATYDFADLIKLQRYFDGEINADQLADTVAVDYRDPAAREADPLARLDDLDTRAEKRHVSDLLLPEPGTVARVKRDFAGAGHIAANADWLRMGAFGASAVLASTLLDNRADKFAKDHASNRLLKGVNKIGNALPWLAIAGAGMAALDGSDPRRSRTGYAATEAGGTAFLVVEGLKRAVGRGRPYVGAGSHAFKPFSITGGYDSFPSGHTIITWAVVTPFAEEYDAPWLYGVAAITNLARVGSRNHWVSDTVAGSLLGYTIGKVFWESSRTPQPGDARVLIHPGGVDVSWQFK